MKIQWVLFSTFVLMATFGKPAPASPQMPAEPMTVEKIRDNIFWVKGGIGANSGFIVGDKEVIVIDVKMAPDSAKEMLAAIGKVTPFPVTTIILTHSDRDHVDGFPGFPKGLKIIAQQNCLKEIKEASASQPFLNDYFPTVTFDDRLSIKSGPMVLELRHYGPAHTSGDAVVDIPAAAVAFIGDLAIRGRDPLIHRRKNGSSAGLVKTLKAVLDYEPAIETFVSGHGDPMDRVGIKSLITSVEEKRAKIEALVAEGRSLAEVKKALGVEEPPAGTMRFPSLAEVIYLEFTEKK
jgi:cyclase